MSSDKELHGICETVVTKLMSEHRWRLLQKDDFIRIVFGRAKLEDTRTESDVTKIAVNEYSQVLHRTCNLDQIPENRYLLVQAFTELGHYLYDIAHKRRECPEDAKDATQQAILDIWQALRDDKFSNPSTFLAGCIWKLRGALTSVDRAKKVGGEKPYSWERDNIATEGKLREQPALFPEEEVERQLLGQEILSELERKFEKHPRAAHQFEAVILKYLGGYSNQEIARELGVPSPGAVSSLLSRGRKKLANNQEFEEIYTRWFSESG